MQWGNHTINIDSVVLSVENWSTYYITAKTNYQGLPFVLKNDLFDDKCVINVMCNGRLRKFSPIALCKYSFSAKNEYGMVAKMLAKPVICEDGEMDEGIWEAFIPQISVGLSDSSTIVENGLAVDTINFEINGVNWTIKTPVEQDGGVLPVEKAKSCGKLTNEIILLRAPTRFCDYNTFCDVSKSIAVLLGIAVGTVAHICQYSKRTNFNERILFKVYNFLYRPMSGWGALRQKMEKDRIRCYLEAAYPIYCKDRIWWNNTVHWYTNLTMCGEIDGGNFYMALLFDRIFHHLKSTEYNRIEQWAIRENIKRENKKDLNFIHKLEYLANRFKVDIPANEFKRIRNKLVHEGEPDLNYPHNMQVHEACLNALTSILLQMLNYNGDFHERSYAKAKPIFI